MTNAFIHNLRLADWLRRGTRVQHGLIVFIY